MSRGLIRGLRYCEISPRAVALTGVMQKFQELMAKGEDVFPKVETAMDKVYTVWLKW